jgi:hypothetical protein
MSGFWEEKIQQVTPPPAPAQPRNTVAPGAWWQQGTEHVQAPQAVAPQQQYQQAGVPAQPGQAQYEYAPELAESIAATDRCPRCGSDEYAAVPVDLSFGGASYGGAALLAETQGKLKKCFDCRYPQMDASGEIVKGKGISAVQAEKTTSLRVRQGAAAKQGSTTLGTLFDNAPLIV